MSTIIEHDVNAIVAHARGDYAEFIAAAEDATTPRRNVRKTNHLARQAGAKAATAANDIPELADEVLFQAHEAESAHAHMVRAIRAEWRYKRLADEATSRAERAEAEVTRLLAANDQLRAELGSVTQ